MDSTIFIHCPKCKKSTPTRNVENTMSVTGRPMLKGNCQVCDTRKSSFVKMNKDKNHVVHESNLE